MNLSRQRQGELFLFGEVALWALFPVITVLSYSTLSPLVSLTISSAFAALFFSGMITQKKLWSEVFSGKMLKEILFATFFLGILYYLLAFIALKFTSPGNASMVGQTQTFFSFLFFHVLRREHIPKLHIFGALFMISGAMIVLASSFHTFHPGDLLILLANSMAPFGNFFVQKARKVVASETIMFIRSAVATIVIFFIALGFGTHFDAKAIQGSLLFLVINGALLLGFSKILWIEGIHRVSVTKANALTSIEPLFTLFFAFMLLKQMPTPWQLTAVIPLALGVILLSIKTAHPPEAHEES